MRTLITVLLTVLPISVAIAQTVPVPSSLRYGIMAPSTPAESSNTGLYITQGLLGLGLGALGGLCGGVIGLEIAEVHCYTWSCGIGTFVYSVLGGYTLGVAGGVYLGGVRRYPRGSFGMTLLGSSFGALAGLGLTYLALEAERDWVGFATPLFPLVGAMIGYHNSRKERLRSALITCAAGQCGLGLPLIVPTRLPAPGGSEQTYPFVLARIRL